MIPLLSTTGICSPRAGVNYSASSCNSCSAFTSFESPTLFLTNFLPFSPRLRIHSSLVKFTCKLNPMSCQWCPLAAAAPLSASKSPCSSGPGYELCESHGKVVKFFRQLDMRPFPFIRRSTDCCLHEISLLILLIPCSPCLTSSEIRTGFDSWPVSLWRTELNNLKNTRHQCAA